MEPFDPDRNEEGSAYSKRRTSILKMPRKSSRSSEVQQPENVVECVKPSDKRMSKRVSFAAANDVLLFSKDVKNTSASPVPLQELTPNNAAQEWIQMKTGEDEPFTGIDSFLKASKQRLMPSVLSDFGENTVCFPAQDLDLTDCHALSSTNQECLQSSAEHGEKAADPLHCLFPQDIFSSPDKPKNKPKETVFSLEPSDNKQRLTMSAARFTAAGSSADVRRSSSGLLLKPEPPSGERTVCFSTHDAGMDMTQCQTALFARDLLPGADMEPKDQAGTTPPALSVDLTFENFFASLSGHKNEEKATSKSNFTLATEKQSSSGLSKRPSMGAQICHVSRVQRPSMTAARFTAAGSSADVRRSSSGLLLKPEPPSGERTVCFSAHDAGMDMTQCQTAIIARDLLPGADMEPKDQAGTTPPALSVDLTFENFFASLSGHKNEEKATSRSDFTLATEKQSSSGLSKRPMGAPICHVSRVQRPSVDLDAEEPVRERTVRFAAEVLLHSVDSSTDLQQELPFSEKTMRFEDALMDETRCLTVKIAEDCAAPLSDNYSILPKCEENTSRFTCDEVTADEPIHLSTTINTEPQRVLDEDSPRAEKTVQFSSEEGVSDESRCLTSNIEVEMNASLDPSPVCTSVTADVPADLKRTEPMVFSNRRCRSLARHEANTVFNVRRSMPWGNPLTPAAAESDFSEAIHTNDGRGVLSIIEEKSIAEAKPKCENVHTNMTKTPVQIRTESGVGSEQTIVEPHDEDRVNEPEQSPASMRKHDESGKSRGAILEDILSKMRRLSQQLMAPDHNLADDNSLTSPPDPELELEKGEAPQTFERDADLQKSATTPFKLETTRLMSRLSVGGFMPKLTKRSQREEAKTPEEPAAAQTHTARFDLDVSDINNEELGSLEEMSEVLDYSSPDKEPEVMSEFQGFELEQELQDDVFDEVALLHKKKRPLQEEACAAEDEKRIRTSNDDVICINDSQTLVGVNNSAANTQTTISSSSCSHTSSLRCDGTLESSSMQSIYESSLEDFTNDIKRKFEDGNITMLEFFKMFHIDFVIHNPRQSVAPGRVSSDSASSQMDVSRDRHIHVPRQQVYKADVSSLTEQVERLKFRMRDLNKPLYLVNPGLWEEMKHFSEAEFKSFSSKLKEIYSASRKMSRAKAHEMKEDLYKDLLKANAEVQEKLRGSIQRADTMLQNLDDCVAELEAELAALEGGVKRDQEELSTVTAAISDHERSASEQKVQNTNTSEKVRRIKEEAKEVDRRLSMLHRMNEWRLKEMTTTTAIYTFLYETLHLKLTYEETEGNEERKIVDVSLKHLLDERSHGHARLVHALLLQVTQAQSWTQRYSSSKHVCDLLRELSLVVSCCRLLGEEVRLLDTWGSMSLDILDIHCVQTEVHVTFSSLRRLQKFEVVFSVGLTNHLYTLQLKSFRNLIGDTTIQNIQEALSSLTPGHKYLTKTIKSIHTRFLS